MTGEIKTSAAPHPIPLFAFGVLMTNETPSYDNPSGTRPPKLTEFPF